MNYLRIINTAHFFKLEQTSRNTPSTELLLYSFPVEYQVMAKKNPTTTSQE